MSKNAISIKILSLVIFSSSIFHTCAIASSWNFPFAIDVKERAYYFDADSVEKNGDFTIVWFKTIQKRNLDTDGSWATAFRYKFNCVKKTVQGLGYTTYDSDGKYLKSRDQSTEIIYPAPDSIAEAMTKLVCKNNFPNYKSSDKDFFKVDDGDLYRATRRLVEFENSRNDPALK